MDEKKENNKDAVAPSAHFALDSNLEYEYEHDSQDDRKSPQTSASRASQLRMSQRMSLKNNANIFDVSYHPGGKILLYCKPKMRQYWGQKQVMVRVNWGDLFFDLFYVGAAYNTSNILVDNASGRGLLYFLATFYSVMSLWTDKTFYDARYVVCGDDLFHRLFEMALLIVLATAVLHIRTVDIMEKGTKNIDTFMFCLNILIGNVLTWLRYIEVYFFGIGQPVMKIDALRWIQMATPYMAMVLTATILAGVEYYGSDKDADAYVKLDTPTADNDDHYRNLATSSYSDNQYETSDTPIYLILFGYITQKLLWALNVRFCFPGGGRHKEMVVPMNIDFTIHRYGEWSMLMLGESILSLLIVDLTHETDNYYATFYSALLTVILLQYLHFRSQPHHADGHALRRHKDAGVGFSCIFEIYSAALISIGAAFTLMVIEFSYSEGHRRFLAGVSSAASLDAVDRKQRTANLFCASMAALWFCLDMMNLFHLGIQKSHSRCQCSVTKQKNRKGIVLIILRLSLLVFMATLSQYETDPQNLAMLGLLGVVLQLVLRKLGTKYLSGEQVHALHEGHENEESLEEENENLKWPNVTRAQAHSPLAN